MVAQAQNAGHFPSEGLNAAQIVEQLQRHNQLRKEGLKHYRALRHYEVVYRGYFRTVAANMEVEVTFDATSGKAFTITSQSGSKFLCEKVLKRAVENELEASKNKSKTAISETNYISRLTGSDRLKGRRAFKLDVKPRHKSRFLFKGTVWVDATDFAVAEIDAEPVENPSFWLSHTRVRHTNGERGGFWLPEHSRSESGLRFGGTAVLTIDYGTYQLTPERLATAAAE